MKKKMTAFFLGAALVFMMVTPALAASTTFTLGGVSGKASLTKSTNSATGLLTYGEGREVTANRTVTVTLTCTKGGKTYTYSDKKTVSTASGHYTPTTAKITVNRPSSAYTVKSAKSNNNVSTKTESWSKTLYV